ncbi:MAG: HNH endonuclease [Rhodobacteraceae bacterium]|nr:HNH endonuclease [Paracoccaceae bacterium]
MLLRILETPAEELVFGARFHAMLAGGSPAAIAACLRRDDWTCHICGIRLRNYMEVDHIHRHEAGASLRTICQFCHDLRHALWAANRGRLCVFWAPALAQIQLTRLAWHVLLASAEEELAPIADDIAADVRRRERVLADIVGTSDPAGILEAMITLKRLGGETEFQQAVSLLGGVLRFWPTAANRISGKAAGLKHWRDGGFRDLSMDLISDHSVDAARLRDLCGRHVPLRFG